MPYRRRFFVSTINITEGIPTIAPKAIFESLSVYICSVP